MFPRPQHLVAMLLAALVAARAPAAEVRPVACVPVESEGSPRAAAPPGPLDTALAEACAAALDRVRADPALARHLRRAYAGFLAGREAVLARPEARLPVYLRTGRQWFDALDGPRAGWAGAWISGAGDIVVAPRPDGSFTVRARADDPVGGSYTCGFVGVGRLAGEVMEVAWDTAEDEDEDDGADGWTLVLRRDGGLLTLAQRRNASPAPTAPFCGVHGSLEETYLPARVVPDPVTAWEPASGAGPGRR
ncbi:hypothetical protein [Methylobacterium oryzisoli]|uniref:hypothetical protein n=1 Tax=Methylobacterium oryzisoli TaxID=3385502 RepID=UPI003891E626